MAISFYNQDIKFILQEKLAIKNWIKSVIISEKKKVGDIGFIFCSDEHLLQMNKQYLQHDYFTDVITFDYSEKNLISGDIFISIDRVKENANTFDCTIEYELHRIMVHGVLHLIGFDDTSPEKKEKMTSKENEYLELFPR